MGLWVRSMCRYLIMNPLLVRMEGGPPKTARGAEIIGIRALPPCPPPPVSQLVRDLHTPRRTRAIMPTPESELSQVDRDRKRRERIVARL